MLSAGHIDQTYKTPIRTVVSQTYNFIHHAFKIAHTLLQFSGLPQRVLLHGQFQYEGILVHCMFDCRTGLMRICLYRRIWVELICNDAVGIPEKPVIVLSW